MATSGGPRHPPRSARALTPAGTEGEVGVPPPGQGDHRGRHGRRDWWRREGDDPEQDDSSSQNLHGARRPRAVARRRRSRIFWMPMSSTCSREPAGAWRSPTHGRRRSRIGELGDREVHVQATDLHRWFDPAISAHAVHRPNAPIACLRRIARRRAGTRRASSPRIGCCRRTGAATAVQQPSVIKDQLGGPRARVRPARCSGRPEGHPASEPR